MKTLNKKYANCLYDFFLMKTGHKVKTDYPLLNIITSIPQT